MRDKITLKTIKYIYQHGAVDLSVRKLAKFIGISTRPIYYHFKDIEDLKKEIIKVVLDRLKVYLSTNYSKQPFLDIGIGYVLFAAKEPDFFCVYNLKNFFNIKDAQEATNALDNYIVAKSGLNDKILYDHIKTYTVGLSVLVSENPAEYNQEIISKILIEAYTKLNS